MEDYPPTVNPTEYPTTVDRVEQGFVEYPAMTGGEMTLMYVGLALFVAGVVALIVSFIKPQE